MITICDSFAVGLTRMIDVPFLFASSSVRRGPTYSMINASFGMSCSVKRPRPAIPRFIDSVYGDFLGVEDFMSADHSQKNEFCKNELLF